ncbi:hypothetical protein ES708_25857 [subsurface metagenome]
MSQEYTRDVTILGQLPISGKVLFRNDFLHHIGFVESGTGGDTIFELDPSQAFQGSQSLITKTRTTGEAVDDQMNIILSTHLPPSKQVTIAHRFLSPSFDAHRFLQFDLSFYDGTNVHQGFIKYIHDTPQLTYVNSGGTETVITAFDHAFNTTPWHFFALSVDFANNLYKYAIIDEFLISLANIPLYTPLNPGEVRMDTSIIYAADAAAACQLSLDEVAILEA